MKTTIIIAILMTAGTPAIAADAYLCFPDMSTGFAFDKTSQKWHPANFNVSGKKYLLKRTAAGFVWGDFGSTLPPDRCDDFNGGGFTFCHGIESVTFNEKSLRFQIEYSIGYTSGGLAGQLNDGENTPFIEIGTCAGFRAWGPADFLSWVPP